MKKDEIIVLLKEQLQLANEQLQQANATVSSLTTQVNELIERIKSLEELLVQKGIAIDKANRQNKALGKLVSGKKSERQEKNPQASMTQEEFDKKKTEQAEKRKERKNNGAKRDMHCEMEEVHVTIDPVMDAEFLKTLRLFGLVPVCVTAWNPSNSSRPCITSTLILMGVSCIREKLRRLCC